MEIEKKIEKERILNSINWDFSDFSSAKYPLDLNSIPWYPATFISPIPRALIACLSDANDTVLDPFGGKGTTAIETLLQNRIPLYSDLNPFIAESTEGLFAAIEYCIFDNCSLCNEKEHIRKLVPTEENLLVTMNQVGVNSEAQFWFHKRTLCELIAIVISIKESSSQNDRRSELIKKLALTAILKSASSQKGHFTYVTDNCKPKENELIERDAIKLYIDKLEQIQSAAKEFITQYSLLYDYDELPTMLAKRQIVSGNAKNLDWIPNKTVDLVVTSPPYLCSQDYIKTMRLINLFFANEKAFSVDVKEEIGARATRYGKSELVVSKFYSDMRIVFKNIDRVLKADGYFALVIGKGKSKVISEYDVVSDLIGILKDEYGFEMIFQKERKIGSRVIRIGGVDKEQVLVFHR